MTLVGKKASVAAARATMSRCPFYSPAWRFGPARQREAGAVGVQGLLEGPPHRANLLNVEFSQIGVGVAPADADLVAATAPDVEVDGGVRVSVGALTAFGEGGARAMAPLPSERRA